MAQLSSLELEFTGQIAQRPPAYSAVKVAGKRAYSVARGGGSVELKERPVQVHAIHLAPLEDDRLSIEVHCGPGTYIRSLARDIGVTLGCGAHLSGLRRTSVGLFDVDAAWSLDDIARFAAMDRLGEVMFQPDEGVRETPAAIVTDENAARLWHGQTVRTEPPGPSQQRSARIYSSSGAFVGMGGFDASGPFGP